MRAHVVLPEELVEAIDRVAGKRGRSKFIEEAVRQKLLMARQLAAVRALSSSLGRTDTPDAYKRNISDIYDWSTPEKVSQWVHDDRQRDTKKFDEYIAERRKQYDAPEE